MNLKNAQNNLTKVRVYIHCGNEYKLFQFPY